MWLRMGELRGWDTEYKEFAGWFPKFAAIFFVKIGKIDVWSANNNYDWEIFIC